MRRPPARGSAAPGGVTYQHSGWYPARAVTGPPTRREIGGRSECRHRYNPADVIDTIVGSRRQPPRPESTAGFAPSWPACSPACRASTSCSRSPATPSSASRPSGCGSRSGAATATGEQLTLIDVAVRHPGHARVTTTQPSLGAAGIYETWISDGEVVRTYSAPHRLGHRTAGPAERRRAGGPGPARDVDRLPPADRPPARDPAGHIRPPGRVLPERPGDGPLLGVGHDRGRRARDDRPRVRPSAHDRDHGRSSRPPPPGRRSTGRPGSSSAWSRRSAG